MPELNIAICFWGLMRSLSFTLPSIQQNIFEPLNKKNIKYSVFLHTFTLNRPYSNKWGGEHNISVNNDDYKLLNPDKCILENQDEVLKRINPKKFLTKGSGWGKGLHIEIAHNFILSMWSLKKVSSLWEGQNFTHIVYCRPDVTYMTPLDISWFTPDFLYVPAYFKFGHGPICDRFALGNSEIMNIYGNRYDELLEYSKKYKIHSETFLSYIIKKNNIKLKNIKFIFVRTRANGCMVNEEYTELLKKGVYTKKNIKIKKYQYSRKALKLFGKYDCP